MRKFFVNLICGFIPIAKWRKRARKSLLKDNDVLKAIHAELMALNNEKVYSGGQHWELELEERLKDPLRLERYGYKVFSQNDEDGIIEEIFHRVGTTDKRFIEFGVQDGFECNSQYLLCSGWSGLWIEGSGHYCNAIQKTHSDTIKKGKLKLKNAFITKDNINELFSEAGFRGEIDFLSVDIDGNDWHILKAILEGKQISPRVICTEYNPLLPPPVDPGDASRDYVLEYNPDWVWNGDDSQGASLSAFYHLLKPGGYSLVGTCVNGVNAFFVRTEIAGGGGNLFYPDKNGARDFFNPWRFAVNRYRKPFTRSEVHLFEGMENRMKIYKDRTRL